MECEVIVTVGTGGMVTGALVAEADPAELLATSRQRSERPWSAGFTR
jgi:hypothetical protein